MIGNIRQGRQMKGQESVGSGWVALFGGIVLLLVVLFAHAEIFEFINEVFFTGDNAAVKQTNVGGGWGELSITILFFFLIIFVIIAIIAMLIGRGS